VLCVIESHGEQTWCKQEHWWASMGKSVIRREDVTCTSLVTIWDDIPGKEKKRPGMLVWARKCCHFLAQVCCCSSKLSMPKTHSPSMVLVGVALKMW